MNRHFLYFLSSFYYLIHSRSQNYVFNKEWLGVFNVIGDGFKNIKGRVAGQYPTFFLKGMHNRKVVEGYAVFVILSHTIQNVFNQYVKE